MRCPYCASTQTQVLETRDASEAVRRRRACGACERRFTTYERVESLGLAVRKRDGRREAFDADKLLRGLVRAAAKRPLGVDRLEGELEADDLGELVLRRLHALDPVAAVRFASVYRRFEDPSQFAVELGRLEAGVADVNAINGSDGAAQDGSIRRLDDDAKFALDTPEDAVKVPQNAARGER
jgi:transcriptional repressor NrdR